jgi:type II secretory pathway component PulM
MSVRRQEPMLRPLAMAAERANRPTAIVVFSGLLLFAAVVFLFWSAKGVSAAEARLRRATNEAVEVQRVAAEITRMRDAGTQSTGEEAKYRPIPTLLSSISASADQSGFSTRPQIIPERDDVQLDGALTKKRIRATVSGQEIGDVLRWVETVLRQVDGLYVSQFKVTPNRTTGWNIELRFSRWELKQ